MPDEAVTPQERFPEDVIIPTDEQITDFYGYESEAGVSYQFLQRFAKWFQVSILQVVADSQEKKK